MKKNKVALVTGASMGIGKELAEAFQEEGYSVIGVSRSKPEFSLFRWFSCDLTEKEDRKSLIKWIETEGLLLDLIIHNAGIGMYGAWAEVGEKEVRHLFELNFFTPIFLTQSLLPYVKEGGGIINVSSVASKFYVPCMGAYCASKSALSDFSHTLRVELKQKEIHVLNLIVGRINTGFSSRAYSYRKVPKTPGAGSSRHLAKTTVKAFNQRKRELVYPFWYRLFQFLPSFFPRFYDYLNVRKWGLKENCES